MFARLKADILSGDLPPGSKLAFASLGQRYAASVGVTREALSRLSELGLVVAEPQVGFRVPAVSAEDLSDLTLARCETEGSALEQSIEHGDLAWETRVVASHYALERTPVWRDAPGDAVSPAWETLHTEFHVALISACPSVRLINIAAALRDAAEIYRSWSHGVTLNTSHRDFAEEHRAIKDAALSRKQVEASDLLKCHLRLTADLLLEYLAAQVASPVM